MTTTMLAVVLLLLLLGVAQGQRPRTVAVTTPLGVIAGRQVTVLNEPVMQFLGVRYAQAPTGPRRFERPQAMEPWPEVMEAQEFGAHCAQFSDFRQVWATEDCLFLNVYVPRTLGPADSRPVMVWIHGGPFIVGDGSGFDGSILALQGDVIVVTVNFRLDVFGWLSTQDSNSPGNLGLWDMNMALQWIQQNIRAFGGDPNRVTIFGESGGAYAVGLHLLSPHNNGLFQRAILQSGGPLTPRVLAYDPLTYARHLSVFMNCTSLDNFQSSALMACLRAAPIDSILIASARVRGHMAAQLTFRLPLGPTVDGEFLQGAPDQLLGQGQGHGLPFQSVALLAGFNSGDGGLVMGSLQPFQRAYNFNMREGIPRQVFCGNVVPTISLDYYQASAAVTSAICREYSAPGLLPPGQGRQAVNMYTDFLYGAPTTRTLTLHSQASQAGTYLYYFSFEEEPSRTRLVFPWFLGANHGDEVTLVFGGPLTQPRVSRETIMSRTMIAYWSNFARFGNPNPPTPAPSGQRVLPQWPPFSQASPLYLELNTTVTRGQNLLTNRVNFWLQEVGLPRMPGNTSSAQRALPGLVVYGFRTG